MAARSPLNQMQFLQFDLLTENTRYRTTRTPPKNASACPTMPSTWNPDLTCCCSVASRAEDLMPLRAFLSGFLIEV
eukprot:Gb_40294 [translate_table: standard]